MAPKSQIKARMTPHGSLPEGETSSNVKSPFIGGLSYLLSNTSHSGSCFDHDENSEGTNQTYEGRVAVYAKIHLVESKIERGEYYKLAIVQ